MIRMYLHSCRCRACADKNIKQLLFMIVGFGVDKIVKDADSKLFKIVEIGETGNVKLHQMRPDGKEWHVL